MFGFKTAETPTPTTSEDIAEFCHDAIWSAITNILAKYDGTHLGHRIIVDHICSSLLITTAFVLSQGDSNYSEERWVESFRWMLMRAKEEASAP